MLSIWFWIMYCCIPTPTTDSNTSTGMIWVTLNMPSAAEECREPSGNFTLSREWSPCIKGLSLYSFSALVGRCPATQSFFLGSNFHCSFVTRNVLHFLWYVYHRYDHLVKLFFFFMLIFFWSLGLPKWGFLQAWMPFLVASWLLKLCSQRAYS